MTTVELTIRFERSPVHETCAWFIPGTHAADWIAELTSWNVPQASLTLRVIPRSRRDRSPVGVLVTSSGNLPEKVSPRCRGYGRVGSGLYLPAEARLEPAVREDELSGLLARDVQYVWHPVSGLAAFEEGDLLSVADLLQPRRIRDVDWNRAHPGESLPRGLVSIEIDQPPTMETIIQAAQDDIASQSDSLDELPPSPGEQQSASGAAGMLGVPLRSFARFVNWAAGQLPAGADHETWVDRLQQWASRVLTPEQQTRREREIDRLLHMPDDDPDQGLKFALPMGGDPGRGVAPPSTHLTPREVDFRLGAGVGGPADPWSVDFERHRRLLTRYRELAEREVRLGRHRRAAYIYAELLGEYASAAAVLKSGGYYREAAVVYAERLNRPREAAQCLEEGGLWDEAIQRYEELGDFEKTGELHRKLEQHDEAVEAFRKAVEIHCQQRNLIQAAHLLITELRDSPNALMVLRSGWPDARQARECLHDEFRLLSHLGRHRDVAKRIQELREQKLNSEGIAMAVDVLVETTRESPDEGVRAQAADTTRVIVARRLVETAGQRSEPDRRIVTALEHLEPQDRLLRRDCERFIKNRKKSVTGSRRPRSTGASVTIESVYRTGLPCEATWTTAAASTQACYAAGYHDHQLIVARIGWEGRVADAFVRWKSRALGEKPILLAPPANDNYPCWVETINGTALPPRRFEAGPAHVISPPWTDRGTVALAQTRQGVSWMLSFDAGFVVSAFSSEHTPILSRQIPMEMTDELLLSGIGIGEQPVPFHARSEGAYFAALNRLIWVDAGENVHVTRHEQQILSLSGSAPLSRTRVAMSYEMGGAVLWPDSDSLRRFGEDLVSPRTTFTVSGFLIAVDAAQIEVYRTDRHQLTFAGSRKSPGTPVAVMPVRTNEFAILDEAGVLHVLRV